MPKLAFYSKKIFCMNLRLYSRDFFLLFSLNLFLSFLWFPKFAVKESGNIWLESAFTSLLNLAVLMLVSTIFKFYRVLFRVLCHSFCCKVSTKFTAHCICFWEIQERVFKYFFSYYTLSIYCNYLTSSDWILTIFI